MAFIAILVVLIAILHPRLGVMGWIAYAIKILFTVFLFQLVLLIGAIVLFFVGFEPVTRLLGLN
jgi:hypothetical protein